MLRIAPLAWQCPCNLSRRLSTGRVSQRSSRARELVASVSKVEAKFKMSHSALQRRTATWPVHWHAWAASAVVDSTRLRRNRVRGLARNEASYRLLVVCLLAACHTLTTLGSSTWRISCPYRASVGRRGARCLGTGRKHCPATSRRTMSGLGAHQPEASTV